MLGDPPGALRLVLGPSLVFALTVALRFTLGAALFLALSAAPTAARTDDAQLELGHVRVDTAGIHCVVDVRIEHLFDAEARTLLHQGVPATVLVDVALWRERGVWFDRRVSIAHVVKRVQYDVWDDVYETLAVRGEGRSEVTIESLADLLDHLSRYDDVRLIESTNLHPNHRYYLVVQASVEPLTPEDVLELEEWVRGHDSDQGDFGLFGLPKRLIGLLATVTGLSRRDDRLRTVDFRARDVLLGIDLARRR